MKRLELEEHRREVIPVTPRQGRHAGAVCLVVGFDWERDPVIPRPFAHSPYYRTSPSDPGRVGVARYRESHGDWVPDSFRPDLLGDYVDWERNTADAAARAVQVSTITTSAFEALRRQLRRRHLSAFVTCSNTAGGQVQLRLSPVDAWALAAALRDAR